MTRSTADIIARINALDGDVSDFFGFQSGDLIGYLPFEDAKPWLNDRAKPENWTPNINTPEAIKEAILAYMPFAWDKANNQRGLSAGRSIDHMKAWLWLLGHENAVQALSSFTHYGKPQLRAICVMFGWDWTQWDDGAWAVTEGAPPMRPEQIAPISLAGPQGELHW